MKDSHNEGTIALAAIIFGLCVLFLISSPKSEREFWETFGELDLKVDCDRLSRCLRLPSDVDFSNNKCVIHKGQYLRRFWIPELRGSLRTCEIMRNLENQGVHGI